MTPDDKMVRFGPPGFFDEADEIHISVLFTWDRDYAYELNRQWEHVAPVKIGGPGWNDEPGGVFIPGKYVRKGGVITSRGCPNRCWFCSVWRREPALIELPIFDGVNILDDNLLACSDMHIKRVFEMLKRQRGRIEFTGGLEAARLRQWHVDLLTDLKPAQMFFALDTPDDKEPLQQAALILKKAGFTRQQLRCYCLIGYPKDTFDAAEDRLRLCVQIGFFPMAMLWRDESGKRDIDWMKFQRNWARPALIYRTCFM